jgi:hypothetical protein
MSELKCFNNIYRAEVIANDDLERKNGMVQVFVPGVYPESAKASGNLPWAEPAMPLFGECNKYSGIFARPAVGSHVWVFFEGGDHMKPVFFATIPSGGWLLSSLPGQFAMATKSVVVAIDESALQTDPTAAAPPSAIDVQSQLGDGSQPISPSAAASVINLPGCMIMTNATAAGQTNVTLLINGMLNIVATNGAFCNGLPIL